MKINSQELQEYIEVVLRASRTAVTNAGYFWFKEPVELDIALVNKTSSGGDLKIFVANVDGRFKSEELTRIKLKITPKASGDLRG